MVGKVGHQIEKIDQLIVAMGLEQGQYQPVVTGGYEIVGVFYTGADPLKVD